MSAASDRTHLVEFDAAIVGYGPVGQAPAALLGRAGHRVVAFERFQEIYRLPRGPSGPRDRGIEDPDDGTTIMEFSSPTRTTRAPCSERDVRNGERAHLPGGTSLRVGESHHRMANNLRDLGLDGAAPLPWHRPTAAVLAQRRANCRSRCLIASYLLADT